MQIVPSSMIENFVTQKVPSIAFPNNTKEFKTYIMDMIDVAKRSNGIGLSGIQVGIPFNMFVAYDFVKKVWRAYFNATYCPLSDSKANTLSEGCLSYPGKTFMVPRFDKVFFEWE